MEKDWFASLKYIVPSDMEYHLEERAAEGYMLKELGPSSFFYFEYDEEMSQKCKYVVDVTNLPKAMYMQTVLEKGWEYMGTTCNCYVWRMKYKTKRPADFADYELKKKHCIKWGIAMAAVSLLFLGVMAALIWGIFFEKSKGSTAHMPLYIVEAVFNFPFAVYFGYLSKRLFSYKKEVRPVNPSRIKEQEENDGELDFLKEEKDKKEKKGKK